MAIVPTKVFFTKGIGVHREKLASFELALRKAGIEKFNLVNVSSIMPPGVKILSRDRALKELHPGQILHCVIARAQSNEPNRLMSASIGVAIPADKAMYGYISEHHAFGQTEKVAGEYAEDLAASMLASTLGIPFDPDQAYDERRDLFLMSRKIVRTRSITQSARADKRGWWTTVLAAAVLFD
ncbi:MAG: arginine decarboxylase, pyruvoyl-dependent [Deltaproteobacteria bacterium]|nr:MAG: arginine decarboxylase, pyruvoyl-dependent [Deltaproteobacteria bacterium]